MNFLWFLLASYKEAKDGVLVLVFNFTKVKYYIISGEASGDLHGSSLIRELRKMDREASIRCWGGDLMQREGGELVKHYRDLAFMGFTEVVKNLGTIMRNLKFAKEDIIQFKPDVLVLIDYPGFNLRIAKWAKQQGLKIIYYISPQVWAWKENRVKAMKEHIDKMIVILPFEEKYFAEKWKWKVEYVGHPLIEVIERHKRVGQKLDMGQRKVVALLPGSRKQEIAKKLPVMLQATRSFPNVLFVIAKAPAVEDSFYNEFIHDLKNVTSVSNRTYDLLLSADAALVTSGTATLETALFNVPEVVCYKGSKVSYWIAKRVIKVKYISLVNLILDKPAVKELIQDEMNAENLSRELLHLLNDSTQIKEDYRKLSELLSFSSNASTRAAEIIVSTIRGSE